MIGADRRSGGFAGGVTGCTAQGALQVLTKLAADGERVGLAFELSAFGSSEPEVRRPECLDEGRSANGYADRRHSVAAFRGRAAGRTLAVWATRVA